VARLLSVLLRACENFGAHPQLLVDVLQALSCETEKNARDREALLKPVYVPESPAEMRRKVKFMSDINYEIRKAETLASVQGVYKREREEIIYNLMRKHYPELFADGPELVKEELERKRAELQGKVHARLPNAPVPKHSGIV